MLRAFTLTEPAEFRALKVPGLRTENGQKMDTTRPKRAPSWLRSGRGGALLAAFHFISKTMADEMATVAEAEAHEATARKCKYQR